jgi:hypothetical protein
MLADPVAHQAGNVRTANRADHTVSGLSCGLKGKGLKLDRPFDPWVVCICLRAGARISSAARFRREGKGLRDRFSSLACQLVWVWLFSSLFIWHFVEFHLGPFRVKVQP